MGARLGFTNGLLIPARKTPTGSGQRALALRYKTMLHPLRELFARAP